MRKKFICVFIVLCLLLSVVTPAFAENLYRAEEKSITLEEIFDHETLHAGIFYSEVKSGFIDLMTGFVNVGPFGTKTYVVVDQNDYNTYILRTKVSIGQEETAITNVYKVLDPSIFYSGTSNIIGYYESKKSIKIRSTKINVDEIIRQLQTKHSYMNLNFTEMMLYCLFQNITAPSEGMVTELAGNGISNATNKLSLVPTVNASLEENAVTFNITGVHKSTTAYTEKEYTRGAETDVTLFMEWLAQSTSNSESLKAYPATKQLYEAVTQFYKVIESKEEDDEESNIEDSIKDNRALWDSSLSDLGKWSTVLYNYVLTGKTNVGIDKEIFDVKLYGQYEWKTENISSKETVEEANVRIQALMSNLLKHVKPKESGVTKVEEDYSDFQFEEISNEIKIDVSTSPGTLNGPQVLFDANKAYQVAKDKVDASCTPYNVALNFNLIAPYQLAKIYGYETQEFQPDADQDVSKINESAFLEAVIASNSMNLESITLATSGGLAPHMSNVAYIDNTKEAFDAYRDLYLNLLFIATYAERHAGITQTANKEYANTELDTLLAEYEKAAIDQKPTASQFKGTLTAYQSIVEGLTYLGIEPWTPHLKAIFNYYNKMSGLFNLTDLVDYNPQTDKEPLSTFFSTSSKKFSKLYNIGVALSTTFIPMQTNLYDPTSLSSLEDVSFIDWHYKYGFQRKALYIDTNINSAVDYYVSGRRSDLRVATLKDLLEPEKDISLYLDDGFYNIDKLMSLEDRAYRSNGEAADQSAVVDQLLSPFTKVATIDIQAVAKANEQFYSDKLEKKIKPYGMGAINTQTTGDRSYDRSLLSDKEIADYLDDDEYSVMQSFAIVSSIYRDKMLYPIMQEQAKKQEPVFVSSPNLAGIVGVGQNEFNSLFNYAMLKNLKKTMGIDYKTSLDINSTIYMDIYGNIVTEGGLVIIPAASNPTLHKPFAYTIYNAGFLSTYGNVYGIPNDYSNAEEFMSTWFYPNDETGMWEVKNKAFNNLYVNFKDVPVADKEVLKLFMDMYNVALNGDCLNFNQHAWIITEVMRGAPIENIDKVKEAIGPYSSQSKVGIYLAYKLEELTSQLLDNNSILTLPNPSYMDGVEYVVMFGFKIMFALMLLALIIKLYNDAIDRSLGLKSLLTFVLGLVGFVVMVSIVPQLMNASYYQVNKLLLQDEAQYIALLNVEKNSVGKEIGIAEVTQPSSSTKMYIKVDDVKIPWYRSLADILMSDAITTMDQIYDEAFENNLLANQPGITRKANGLYVDVDYLLDTSSIVFNLDRKFIYQKVHTEPTASFVLPYYVVLDQLVASINSYNQQNNILTYTCKIQDNGQIKTIGMVEAYFTSNEFMQNQDVLGFKYIYDVNTTAYSDSVFLEEDVDKMKASQWYCDDRMTQEELRVKIDQLDEEARYFVAENKDLLGKITDETFLKIMALSLSLEHNRIMNVPAARSMELFSVDSKDIIRLSIASRQDSMENSASSFSRFVYNISGGFGVLLTALLVAVYFASGLIKPVVLLFIIVAAVFSVLYKSMIKRQSSRALEGFLITLALLCGTNIVYCLVLKLSMLLPQTGLTSAVSIIVQIILQLAHVLIITALALWVLYDIDNMGFTGQVKLFANLQNIASDIAQSSKARFASSRPSRVEKEHSVEYEDAKPPETGQSVLAMMRQRDEERSKSINERWRQR